MMSRRKAAEKVNDPKRKIHSLGLTIMFTFVVFFILLISIFIALLIIISLAYIGLYTPKPDSGGVWLIAYFATVSVLVSLVASFLFSRLPLAPIRQVIHASEELARGNFDVRIQLKGPRELKNLNRSFNHMAEELGSLELLRSDFVNHFSHEFKTPIASMRGFAKLLKRKNLTEKERDEYLDIIINESARLGELADHVLYLSSIEHQSILTEKQSFNLAEQIRQAVIVTDQKWTSRNMGYDFDADEVMITANADLLSQVWINLLDNAVKFSPPDSAIRISVRTIHEQVYVSIQDQGVGIDPQQQPYIFDKFYQADDSRSTSGNGLGLSIVRQIVLLHGGAIQVAQSDASGTTFEVQLPIK